ncbi:MAG: putative integral rane protein [Acidimicrobiales bacterium]|nr:putative integral rane protein [Acidimicrobiales bacterium]
MTNSDDRITQFKSEIADLQVKTSGKASAEKITSIVGLVLMVAAIVIGIGSYRQAGQEDSTLDQNELIILALACVSMAIVGAALWIRNALVTFWRFWMLRSLYEGQAHLDQIVKAITDSKSA